MKNRPYFFVRGLAAVVSLAALLSACSTEVDRTNKFDENAPSENQARATLRGQVALEAEIQLCWS